MALGTIDSINHIKSGIANGTIHVVETANGWQVSGDTYPVKEYIKREFSAKWDKDAQAWNIAIDDHYEGGRDSYHYGIFADACKPAEQPEAEATEADTADELPESYEIDVYDMEATYTGRVWHIEYKTKNGSFEPVEHFDFTEADMAENYDALAFKIISKTQPAEVINDTLDYVEFRDVVLSRRVYDSDSQLLEDEELCRKHCISKATRHAFQTNTYAVRD